MNIIDNSKIVLGKDVFNKIFSMNCNHIPKYLRLLEYFEGIETRHFTINEVSNLLKISEDDSFEIIEILKTLNLVNIIEEKLVLNSCKDDKNTIILNRATLKLLLDFYDLTSQDIVVAIGLLYLAESSNGLVSSTYLKSILSMEKELLESSISRLENKKLIRIDESFSEDDLVKIVEYEIHF